jgi:hypothetical protein
MDDLNSNEAVRTGGEGRFTIVDAILLIAATAVAFGVLRDWIAPIFTQPLPPLKNLVNLPYLVLGPFNFYWTVALLAIRLRHPRPTLRSSAGNPVSWRPSQSSWPA